MVKKPQDTVRDNFSSDAAELTQLYRSRANELPPAYLDNRIIEAANTVPPKPWVPHGPFDRWAGPAAAAAVIVLCVTLVLHVSREGLTPLVAHHSEKTGAPAIHDQEKNLVSSAEARRSESSTSTDSSTIPPAIESTASSALRAKPVPRDSTPTEPQPFTMEANPGNPSNTPGLARQHQQFTSRKREPEQESGFIANQPPAKTTDSGVPLRPANILAVNVNGSAGAYQFTVTLNNHGLDCESAADWWEIVSEKGDLIYRRLLERRHLSEQPINSIGEPVAIDPDTVVWIRLHQASTGYATTAMKGSVSTGFKERSVSRGFAVDLSTLPPLPPPCNP